MADNKNLQSSGFDPSHRILRMSGYAAAAAFCAVSVGANLQFGLLLGRNPIDKATYAVASVSADVFKIAAPLLALALWNKRFRILAIAGLVLWLGCAGWSMASAVGFVLSSRGHAIAERAAEAATRHGWEAKVERAESQLATLGKHRPASVINAELASAAVPLHIWRRSRQCFDLTLEESRLACAPVLGLRMELAAAEAAERLEAQLVAGRTQLATASVAGSVADPQASALARLIGADEGTIRTGIALLLAGLVEVGSALGFTLVSMATASNPQPLSTTKLVAGSSDPAGPQVDVPRSTGPKARERRVQSRNTHGVQTRQAAVGSRIRGACTSCQLARTRDTAPLSTPRAVLGLQVNSRANPQLSSRGDALDRWIQTRLNVDPGGSVPARDAYADFCRWARSSGIVPCTETRFGRDFTARIIHLGGVKIKRRDRAYYVGVVSQDSQCVGNLALRSDPRQAVASSRPPWEWTYTTPLTAD
jgi:hypothetical protein